MVISIPLKLIWLPWVLCIFICDLGGTSSNGILPLIISISRTNTCLDKLTNRCSKLPMIYLRVASPCSGMLLPISLSLMLCWSSWRCCSRSCILWWIFISWSQLSCLQSLLHSRLWSLSTSSWSLSGNSCSLSSSSHPCSARTKPNSLKIYSTNISRKLLQY